MSDAHGLLLWLRTRLWRDGVSRRRTRASEGGASDHGPSVAAYRGRHKRRGPSQARRLAKISRRPGSPDPPVTASSKVMLALRPSSSRVATWFENQGWSWVRCQVMPGASTPARRERRRPARETGFVQATCWRRDFSLGRALRRGEQTAWWTLLLESPSSNEASAR